MRSRRILFIILFVAVFCGSAHSQYYDWGRSPSTIKWSKIKTPTNSYVFPTEYGRNAVRVMNIMDTVHRQISYGYTHGPMRMPVVMHTQNFNPNGIVMLAPKRMEFIVMPGGAASATPWFKQLAVHEYRHSVQFSNLNRSLIRILSYPLGQQGSLIGVALMPSWFMEGDAVMTETQMTTFGRGLQPSFTIEYRAMFDKKSPRYAIDKYFCGSYKDYMPDHYQVGYQIASWADTHYGENIGNKMAWYGSRNPYFIFTSSFANQKYYKTTVDKMFYNTFADLQDFWNKLPRRQNSAQIISTPITSYTTYMAPVQVCDTLVVAVKKDLDRASRIVAIDPRTGSERRLRYTGVINTTPTYANGKLLWSEYRPSTLWAQRVNSVMCSYDLATDRMESYPKHRHSLYPVPMPSGEVAGVEYNYNGTYSIRCGSASVTLPDSVALYGLAHDAKTDCLYALAMSDSGMWIGASRRVSPTQLDFCRITTPSYATLSNLRAADGRLFFNSIASGLDEVHIYDLAWGKEYRATTSTYGSFQASPTPGDTTLLTLTTYTDKGYMLSQQSIGLDTLPEVLYSNVPTNVVNPVRRKWNVMNIDTIRVEAETTPERPAKRYRKGLHLMNVHSWMPVSIDPSEIIDEYNFSLYAGVTVMSQNLLASTFGELSYGWTDAGSMVRGSLKYYGLAPKFEVETQWGGRKQSVVQMKDVPLPDIKSYFDITGRVYLPMQLAGGYMSRTLTPILEWTHVNMVMPNKSLNGYKAGAEEFRVALQYVENVRMAPRDLLPRWGYALKASYLSNPLRSDFGQVWSGYGRLYTPGIAPHHSITLRGVVQYQKQAVWNFSTLELFPRGSNAKFAAHHYGSFAFDYQFPFWYPDGGIASIIYFKRLRANLTFDYARYTTVQSLRGDLYSYGGDLIVDLCPFRLPGSVTAEISISVHKASDNGKVVVGAGLALPF